MRRCALISSGQRAVTRNVPRTAQVLCESGWAQSSLSSSFTMPMKRRKNFSMMSMRLVDLLVGRQQRSRGSAAASSSLATRSSMAFELRSASRSISSWKAARSSAASLQTSWPAALLADRHLAGGGVHPDIAGVGLLQPVAVGLLGARRRRRRRAKCRRRTRMATAAWQPPSASMRTDYRRFCAGNTMGNGSCRALPRTVGFRTIARP